MIPGLLIRNLSFAYRGMRKPALKQVDFSVAPGEFVALIGPTGAGKSTLVRAASGIVPGFFKGPFSGDVLVGGEKIDGKGIAELAGRVGTVFQDFEAQLFSTNVRLECAFGMENLGIAREEMRVRIERNARITGIAHLMDREPQSLSGGQKQRLALASVLCLQPEILLCDEPTTDLDPEGKADLLAVLDELRRHGNAIVLVEHDTERLIGVDRIVVMAEGAVIAAGRPEEILGDPAFCRQHGIFPPQLYELCQRLGLRDRPRSVEAALEVLHRERFTTHPPLLPSPLPAGEPLLTLDRVSFRYPGGDPVLDDVSLQINRGDFVALLGPNGSGKTTLVKHLNGLLRPVSGRVLFRGETVERIGTTGMGRRVGFVFQNPDHMLFEANAFREVAFGLRNFQFPESEIPKRISRALEAVGLAGREEADPYVMTKGERQKLAVACVLACEPEILILDEPTTGLDAGEQIQMMTLLQRLNEVGHTIIIVTHSMEIAAGYARRVLVMGKGNVLADGDTREVFSREDILKQGALSPPPVTRLGLRLGITPLTVGEMVASLRRTLP